MRATRQHPRKREKEVQQKLLSGPTTMAVPVQIKSQRNTILTQQNEEERKPNDKGKVKGESPQLF